MLSINVNEGGYVVFPDKILDGKVLLRLGFTGKHLGNGKKIQFYREVTIRFK